MQIFNIDNIGTICSCVIIFTKEGGINYDEIFSKGGRKIC